MTRKYHYTKKTGRPSDFKSDKFKKDLADYLALSKDEVEVVRGRGGSAVHLKVKLPTIEGFTTYLGVAKGTIHNWRKVYPEVEEALEQIKTIQLERLINEGLAGYYNPTIAKLILSANHGMGEEINTKVTGEVTHTFDDQQIDRIAERIASRSRGNGDPSSE